MVQKELSEQVVDDKLITDAVNFINGKFNETIYKCSIEIGEYILKTFFNNNINFTSSKNPKKFASFNKLCEREDLSVHPNTLALMVRVASQEQFFIKDKIETSGLSYTHKAALVKMDNTQAKNDMVKECRKHKWTTRHLEKEIKNYFELKEKRPISLIITTKKVALRIGNVLESIEDNSFDVSTKDLQDMAPAKREKLNIHMADLKEKIDKFSEKSKSLKKSYTKIFDTLGKIQSKAGQASLTNIPEHNSAVVVTQENLKPSKKE